MEVYFKDKDKIKKYLVCYDEDKLNKLRKEIIDNCGLMSHRVYEDSYGGPNLYNQKYSEIRNYKTPKFICNKDYDSSTESFYLYEYDLYEYPYLIKLIDRLIDNDTSCIFEIYNFDSKKETSLDEEIAKRNSELSDMNLSFSAKEKILNDLKELYSQKKLNKNRKPIEGYYLKLQEMLIFELVDEILIADVERVNEFFEIPTNTQEIIDVICIKRVRNE